MAEALGAFHFPDDLWARLIYDLVLVDATGRGRHGPDGRRAGADLLRAGRQLRIETRNQTTTDAEERVERQAREFELLKPYLVDRWRAGWTPRRRLPSPRGRGRG